MIIRGMKYASISLVLFFCSGCISNVGDSFRDHGLPLAAFELGCDQEKISINQFSRTQVGVSGCGKKAVYVRTPGGADEWINKTGGDDKEHCDRTPD